MIARLLDDLQADNRWITEHLEFRFTPSFSTLRQANPAKVWELLKVYGRLLRLAARHGRADLLIYPSGGPQTVPILRDLLLLPFVRLFAKRLWIQFHAAGIADRLQQRRGFLERLLRMAYTRADGAIVMTDYNRRDPLALGIAGIEVIPHRLKDENAAGKLPDYTKKPLYVLHAGHLCHLKGTPQVVEAFGRVASQFPDWHLLLMGEFLSPYSEEECRARCKELGIGEKVKILGVLRGKEKTAYFAASHLFVFASVAPYESFGLVVTEAMMWGLPLLVSDWRGNREVAGEAGVLFETGPSMASNLEEKLRILLDDNRGLSALAERSRARFSALFREDNSGYRGLVTRLTAVSADAR